MSKFASPQVRYHRNMVGKAEVRLDAVADGADADGDVLKDVLVGVGVDAVKPGGGAVVVGGDRGGRVSCPAGRAR